VKTVKELEADLQRMRRETPDYSLDPSHDPKELLRRKGECNDLWGAIECLKKGTTPVLPSQAKYLE
jgi:hypothetical protein